MFDPLPRLLPNRPFPPYSYVPGRFPHPVTDPAGHSFGHAAATLELSDDTWADCDDYIYGIELFNHGYYWEAHEAWEGVWHAVGHDSRAGVFLKGLIKLAAAGVKAREGRAVGVARHLARARELFTEAATMPPADDGCGGLSLAELAERASALYVDSQRLVNTVQQPVVRVFPLILWPR